jgi:hypothetical protein
MLLRNGRPESDPRQVNILLCHGLQTASLTHRNFLHQNVVRVDPRADTDSVDVLLGLMLQMLPRLIIMLGILPPLPIRSHGMLFKHGDE